MQRKQ